MLFKAFLQGLTFYLETVLDLLHQGTLASNAFRCYSTLLRNAGVYVFAYLAVTLLCTFSPADFHEVLIL